MHQLAQYIMTLTALSMIIGIILSFFQEGTIYKTIKIIAGVILTIAAISPLAGISLPDLRDLWDLHNVTGEHLIANGKILAEEAKEIYIQQHLESYISDKASVFDADITPEIMLNENGIPVGVELHGSYTAQVKQAITDMITNDLGIPEEDLKWTGKK